MAASAIASFSVINTLSMMSLPVQWFLLSIDFNCHIGTRWSTKGTSDAAFGFSHVNDVVSAAVILDRIGQHVLGTESDRQAATPTPFSVNYYCSFWHVCALSENIQNVCRRSSVLPRREWAPGSMIGYLWHSVSVLCGAIRRGSGLHVAATLL